MTPTIICNQWDIAIIPFPFVDNSQQKPRPVLAISQRQFNKANAHTVFAMITTGKSTKWSSDTQIKKLTSTGLTVKSIIRMKIFTLDNRLIKRIIGKLELEDIDYVSQTLSTKVI